MTAILVLLVIRPLHALMALLLLLGSVYALSLELPTDCGFGRDDYELDGSILASNYKREAQAVRFRLLTADGAIELRSPRAPWIVDLLPGAQVKVQAKVEGTCAQGQPPDIFSYQGFLYRSGVQGYGRAGVVSVSDVGPGLKARDALVSRLLERFGNTEALAVLVASTLAERDLVGESLRLRFLELGLSHVLVVSGFHIGVLYLSALAVGFACYQCLPTLGRFVPRQVLVGIFAAALTIGYCALVGTAMATVRALAAILIFTSASVVGRRIGFGSTVLYCLVLFLALSPGSVFNLGFQLTFGALAGLVLASRLRPFGRIATACGYCCFPWAATAPILLLHLGTIAPLGPLMNLLLLPIFSWLVIAVGGVAVAMYSVGLPGAEGLIHFVLGGIDIVLLFIEFVLEGTAESFLTFQTVSSSRAKHYSMIILIVMACCALLLALPRVVRYYLPNLEPFN